MRFTLYPIYWLADHLADEQFDEAVLPFPIAEDVGVECLADRFRVGRFDDMRERLGAEVVRKLEGVRYALVHRYEPAPIVAGGLVVGEHPQREQSETLVRGLAACLRLIRPMRQEALLMHGSIRDEDGSFDVMGCDIPPLHLIEVPEVQKLFQLRNRDVEHLRAVAPAFLRAMRGEFWKFRMAVQFHDLGHFQTLDWKARYLLWCSAIESIFTSHNFEHRGSLVATSRIKWFLGENESIYAPGDLFFSLADPHITIGQVIGDLYEMRNFMAHGDRIPDTFFRTNLRAGINGEVTQATVLIEAASFVVRTSLLKILGDGLLDHFADAGPAEAFFGGHGLTRSALNAARRGGP
jgi:hypothetical protein